MVLLWEMTMAELCHSTASIPIGYLSPGDWVQGEAESVEVIDREVLMSGADQIRSNWTVSRLWLV